MKINPAVCDHTHISKSVKIETVSVPELQIEQLVIRVKVFCRDCKEAYVPKTMSCGFSTEEVGVVGDEIFIPLEEPHTDEMEGSDEALRPSDKALEPGARTIKDHLH